MQKSWTPHFLVLDSMLCQLDSTLKLQCDANRWDRRATIHHSCHYLLLYSTTNNSRCRQIQLSHT